jgi:hypothetical protein
MIECTDINDPLNIADWVEFYVIYSNQPISKAKMGSLTAADEETVDSTIGELGRRQLLYGNSSPFQLNGSNIEPKFSWENKPELMLCLIFTLRGVERVTGQDDGTKLFERLSGEAAKAYLVGEAEVIGFPNRVHLIQQIEQLSQKTHELLGIRQPDPQDKDKGVDVVAWKPHGDNRENQVVLLLQCAAGANFSEKKQISLRAWRELIHWSVDPIRGIMIPHIPSREEWHDIMNDYDLIFDRVRIFKALYNATLPPDLIRDILLWCQNKLQNY